MKLEAICLAENDRPPPLVLLTLPQRIAGLLFALGDCVRESNQEPPNINTRERRRSVGNFSQLAY